VEKLVSPTSFLAGIPDMTRTFCVYSTERREHRFAGTEKVVNDGERYARVM